MFLDRLRRRRTVRRGTPSPIAELALGKSQLVRGRVGIAAEPLAAPTSGGPCVCYRVDIEQLGESVELASRWDPLASAQGGTTFLVDDGTGRVLVDASAHFELLQPVAGESPRLGDLGNVRVAGILRSQGRDPGPAAERPDSLRWLERVVRPGDTVTVLGTAQGHEPNVHGEPAGPRSLPMMLVVRGSATEPVLIRVG